MGREMGAMAKRRLVLFADREADQHWGLGPVAVMDRPIHLAYSSGSSWPITHASQGSRQRLHQSAERWGHETERRSGGTDLLGSTRQETTPRLSQTHRLP